MESYSRSRTSQGTTLHSHFHRSLSPKPNRFCSSSISRRPAPVVARSPSPTRTSLSASSTVRFSTSNHSQHDQKSSTSPISNLVTRPAPVLSRSTSPTRNSLGRSASSTLQSSTSNHRQSNTLPLSTRPAPVARSTSPTRISLGRPASSTVPFSTSNHRQHDQKSSTRPLSSAPKKTCACSPTTHPGSYRCILHKNNPAPGHVNNQMASSSNHQLNMRKSVMKNSLVRLGTVEGDLVKRTLALSIRPSSNSECRREDFQPRPSRLSIMSMAEES